MHSEKLLAYIMYSSTLVLHVCAHIHVKRVIIAVHEASHEASHTYD
jgi:hypothetical protein